MTDLPSYVRTEQDGSLSMRLATPAMHCAGCMGKIERGLGSLSGIKEVRSNLSAKRVFVRFAPDAQNADGVRDALTGLGFENTPLDPVGAVRPADTRARNLLKAMAVAGFAMANIMLLSVAVWSGTDMESATRTLFHWLSAMIALPAVAYAGQPFFRSALGALRVRSVNMDVPISLAVILATGMSLFETIRDQGAHTYFDASVMLLFFLLIGRYLDELMRARAVSAAEGLLRLTPEHVSVIHEDGTRATLAVADVTPGMTIFVAAGARLALDGEVIDGIGDVDTSLLTGEAAPESVAPGSQVYAGTLALTAPLTLRVTAAREDTVLADIVRLTEAAERNRGRFVRLADMAAQLYVPVVHTLALGTFMGWWVLGGDPMAALRISVAVLIITCPCALGLAVPVVQIVAVGSLFGRGALVKSGDAVERLAQADTVVFDKTGTLTTGQMTLDETELPPVDVTRRAAALATHTSHPLARALAAYGERMGIAGSAVPIRDVEEVPGMGLTATVCAKSVRFGRGSWVAGDDVAGAYSAETRSALFYREEENGPLHRFAFTDDVRSEIPDVVAALKKRGKKIHVLSGDHAGAVGAVAMDLGADHWRADCHPGDKVSYLDALKAKGGKTVMVGDGLNDAPALKAAHASVSPSSAADISRTAADVVLPGTGLSVLPDLIRIARRARGLMLGNFALAAGYNAIAIPIAVAGYVTPLIAALAMSGSSLIVTMNALRLKLDKRVTVQPPVCPGRYEVENQPARKAS